MTRHTRTIIVVLLGATCAGHAAATRRSLASPTPNFDVAAFFSGTTEGEGRLRVLARRAKAVRVHGAGTIDASGKLTLMQTVEQQGKASSSRTWVIVAMGNDRYGGSLTGTTAPIRGSVTGNCLHLWLKFKGGLDGEQRLYLQPGGRVAFNRMTIRKMGIRVAVLDETIRKVD